ncbi:unnamed protein product [Schistosoma spindalis]|nr:unnamed protein product [Schistosoma spindale]
MKGYQKHLLTNIWFPISKEKPDNGFKGDIYFYVDLNTDQKSRADFKFSDTDTKDSKPMRYVARTTVRMFLEAKEKMLDSSTKQTHDWTGLIGQVKEAFRKDSPQPYRQSNDENLMSYI